MQYYRMPYEQAGKLCRAVFESYGFDAVQSAAIVDVLLAADLCGIESHGVQRLVRYHAEINSGMVDVQASPVIVRETPLSATLDANRQMGQLASIDAMRRAIQKAQATGVGMVAVRNSNHYGIAGYYAQMAADQDLIGICMTNSEAIMVPTFARQPMLGTNPIAFAMPADPVSFLFDAATTVVPRGKLEVYKKQGQTVPDGWILDQDGNGSNDPTLVLDNIIEKRGGGILPLGGTGETTGGYKGYGFGMICEIMCAILSLGTTSDLIYGNKDRAEICHFFGAFDYGMFGDKAEIKSALSEYLQKVRNASLAEGQPRIYTHGEKEREYRVDRSLNGILLNEKTLQELRNIATEQSVDPSSLDLVIPV